MPITKKTKSYDYRYTSDDGGLVYFQALNIKKAFDAVIHSEKETIGWPILEIKTRKGNWMRCL